MKRRLALALLLVPWIAHAHQPTVSYSELRVAGAEVTGTLRFSLADLRRLMVLDPSRLEAPALEALVARPFSLRSGGETCPLSPGTTARADGEDGVLLDVSWICPGPIEVLDVRVGFLETFPAGHTHLVKISFPDGLVAQRVAQLETPAFQVSEARAPLREARRFVLLGIEHIFTGYDHIAFLVALLLLGGTFRGLIGIVTAFTVAHSITLALATLGILAPSPRIVEPMIAASIVYVGAENLWALRARHETQALAHRWMITFAFGLVHGFGFASVLRDLHLPRGTLAVSLVSFNFGVELGQICIVAIAWPVVRRLRRGEAVPRLLSGVICALGAVWLVQRLAGF